MSQYQPMYDSFQRTPRDRYVPTPRISVAANVSLPAGELDPYTGQPVPPQKKRCRTQGKQLEYEEAERKAQKMKTSFNREIKKGGVRVTQNTAIVLCALLGFICLFTILYQSSVITSVQEQLNILEADLTSSQKLHEELSAELEEARDISQIGSYAARNLGMIRSEAVDAVHLTAVDTRPMENSIQSVQALEMSAQVQTTQAPAIASAGK